MKDILPEVVRTRQDKAAFGLYGRDAVLRMLQQGSDYMENTIEVWNYVDKKKYKHAINIMLKKDQPSYIYSRCQFLIMRTISLSLWLDWFNERKSS